MTDTTPPPETDGSVEKTPQDFEAEDSFGDDGLECCACCEKTLGSEHGHHGEVYTQAGRRYDHLLNSDPGEKPFFCPDCWPQLEANRKASKNKTLGEFV